MLELVDDLRERATEEAFADSEHHAAGSKFAKFGQSIEECFPIGELGTVIFESQLPRRRQFNRPPPPLNERHTKFLLELRELPRSEEHTSELQSLMRISYAVFCLKKKQQKLATKRDSTDCNTQHC